MGSGICHTAASWDSVLPRVAPPPTCLLRWTLPSFCFLPASSCQESPVCTLQLLLGPLMELSSPFKGALTTCLVLVSSHAQTPQPLSLHLFPHLHPIRSQASSRPPWVSLVLLSQIPKLSPGFKSCSILQTSPAWPIQMQVKPRSLPV